MRKSFQFNLGQSSGEYYVTMAPTDGSTPSFMFVKRTRQDAIDAAIQGISTWLRHMAKTPPKSVFRVDKTERYIAPTNAQGQTKKPKKFGGIPIKQVTPNEVITVSVEV